MRCEQCDFLLKSVKLKTPRRVTYINSFGELNKTLISLIIKLMKMLAQYLFYTADTTVTII